jgi:predicted GNAT family N-acyltransferase
MKVELKRIPFATPDYADEVALRSKILREPLGLKLTTEELALEVSDIHLGAYSDQELVACLVLKRLSTETMKMRQVAVAEDYQGKGIGQQLVRFSEFLTQQLGCHSMELNARLTAVDFYLKLGYKIESDGTFSEVGLPHHKMRKIF